MSELLRILENDVQLVVLFIFILIYTLRLLWIFKFPSRKEKTLPAGDARKGIGFSMLNVAMPWAMVSTRKKPGFYAQFVIFHLGVGVAIGSTFVIPYGPALFEKKIVVILLQSLLAAALCVGLYRLFRRIFRPDLRLISSADDYFSLVLMIIYFGLAIFAIPNQFENSEWPLILFFGLTAFLLIYVPFSKICHYLYYPFTRFFLGRNLGHRGILYKNKSCVNDQNHGIGR